MCNQLQRASQFAQGQVSNLDGWPWRLDCRARVADRDVVDWPRITVVTPSYNQARYLEATIRSVILQAYPNLEYLVLDGGSSDGSAEVIKKYEAHLAYWHSRKDGGQADAIASGFEMSTGEILCWLNSDDILLPGALFHVGRLFAADRRTKFVYGNRLVIDEDGAVIGHHVWPYLITKYHWALGQFVAQESCFWRRDLYVEVGGIDRDKFFIMDYDLFYRMWRATVFRKTSAFLGCIRMHGETKNSRFQEVRKSELANALRGYELVVPGYFMVRLLNRLDRLQAKVESVMRWRQGQRESENAGRSGT